MTAKQEVKIKCLKICQMTWLLILDPTFPHLTVESAEDFMEYESSLAYKGVITSLTSVLNEIIYRIDWWLAQFRYYL